MQDQHFATKYSTHEMSTLRRKIQGEEEYALENLLVFLSVKTKTGSGTLNLGSSISALTNGMRVRGKGC